MTNSTDNIPAVSAVQVAPNVHNAQRHSSGGISEPPLGASNWTAALLKHTARDFSSLPVDLEPDTFNKVLIEGARL